MFDYNGRLFRAALDGGSAAPVARYHQDGDLLWGECSGGPVRRGAITGTVAPGGALDFGYCFALADGTLVVGRCHSVPHRLADGRVALTEYWERYLPAAGAGVSALEEVNSPAAAGDSR